MKRALAVGIHLALAALAALWLGLWGASPWYSHSVYLGDDRGTSGFGVDLRSTPGALECVGITFESEPGRTARGWNASFNAYAWSRVPSMIRHREWVRGGFGLHRWEQLPKSTIPGPKYTNRYVGLALPFWLLALLCAIPPALRWNPRSARRRRAAAGLCPTCGYDLRATPGRCPECGTVPEKPPNCSS